MREGMYKLLKAKNFVVSSCLMKVALVNKLSLEEFLLLIYFDNNADDSFQVDEIEKELGIDFNSLMIAFNNLMLKGLVKLESVKDKDGHLNEVVRLDCMYDSIMEDTCKEVKDDNEKDIYKLFEGEFGRLLTSTERTLIEGWLETGISEEMIKGALEEAVFNGVSSFRYIDTILFEWDKKGFKTMKDVEDYMKNNSKEKYEDREVLKMEQQIADFDWLNSNEN